MLGVGVRNETDGWRHEANHRISVRDSVFDARVSHVHVPLVWGTTSLHLPIEQHGDAISGPDAEAVAVARTNGGHV